jgi:hypothetical protein
MVEVFTSIGRDSKHSPSAVWFTLRNGVPLASARCFHRLLNDSGGLTQALVIQFLILNQRYLDVDVDAVEQGTGDALLVFGNDAGQAGAELDQVAKKSTGAGVQCNTTACGKV